MGSGPTVDVQAYRRFLIGLAINTVGIVLAVVAGLAWVLGGAWRVELFAGLFLMTMGLLQCLLGIDAEGKLRSF